MKKILLTIGCVLPLAGCNLSGSAVGDFFQTNDPCVIASSLHVGFVTVAAKRVSAEVRRAENTAYVGFREYCAGGALDKPTLQRALDTYIAAVAEYEKG